jgi:hypothetical protein
MDGHCSSVWHPLVRSLTGEAKRLHGSAVCGALGWLCALKSAALYASVCSPLYPKSHLEKSLSACRIEPDALS